jgi:probable HAF family extracellular repeat protein
VVDLGTLSGLPFATSVAAGLNNNGLVVGSSNAAGGYTHGFAWTSTGGMMDLGSLGGSDSSARFATDSGDVIGASDMPNGDSHAVVWHPLGL